MGILKVGLLVLEMDGERALMSVGKKAFAMAVMMVARRDDYWESPSAGLKVTTSAAEKVAQTGFYLDSSMVVMWVE